VTTPVKKSLPLYPLVFLALLTSSLGFAAKALAQAEVIPAVPKSYFNDYAHVVNQATSQKLNRQLAQFDRDTTIQVLVAIYPRMQSDALAKDYTMRVANKWGVGQKGRNNGVVLFLFTESHRLQIQTGSGLEAVLPDALCKQIIDERIIPHLRQGDFDGGLQAGVVAILAAIQIGTSRP